MRRFPLLVRGLGAAGAAANAKAELEAIHRRDVQATVVVRKVTGSDLVRRTRPAA